MQHCLKTQLILHFSRFVLLYKRKTHSFYSSNTGTPVRWAIKVLKHSSFNLHWWLAILSPLHPLPKRPARFWLEASKHLCHNPCCSTPATASFSPRCLQSDPAYCLLHLHKHSPCREMSWDKWLETHFSSTSALTVIRCFQLHITHAASWELLSEMKLHSRYLCMHLTAWKALQETAL